MKCDEARSLLSLYRPGERSDEETRTLEMHLRSCAACRRVHQQFRLASQTMHRIGAHEPVLPDPAQFTHEVMARLSAGKPRQAQTRVDILLLPAQRPAVRTVLVAVVLVAIVVLGAQTYDTLTDVHKIEERFSRGTTLNKDDRVRYEIDLSKVPVTREQQQALRTAGIIPEVGLRLMVTDQLMQNIRSLVGRPTIFGKSADVLGRNLDWNSLIHALEFAVPAQPIFSEIG